MATPFSYSGQYNAYDPFNQRVRGQPATQTLAQPVQAASYSPASSAPTGAYPGLTPSAPVYQGPPAQGGQSQYPPTQPSVLDARRAVQSDERVATGAATTDAGTVSATASGRRDGTGAAVSGPARAAGADARGLCDARLGSRQVGGPAEARRQIRRGPVDVDARALGAEHPARARHAPISSGIRCSTKAAIPRSSMASPSIWCRAVTATIRRGSGSCRRAAPAPDQGQTGGLDPYTAMLMQFMQQPQQGPALQGPPAQTGGVDQTALLQSILTLLQQQQQAPQGPVAPTFSFY